MHVYNRAGKSAPGEREKRLFLVELSLHGAAGYKERQGCLWTGGSTARGCMIGGGRRLHLGGSGHTWLHD